MYEYEAVVTSVYDGDTFRADVDLGWGIWARNTSLRLNRIDAPELRAAGGGQSKEFVAQIMPVGSEFILHTIKDKKDKYGRMLAEVIYNNQSAPVYVSDELVKAGLAKYWNGKGPRP